MTLDQLIAAMERRGYLVQLYPPREGPAKFTIEFWRNNGPITPGTPGEVRSFPPSMLATAPSISDVAETFLAALSGGQRHMACAQCGEPLLMQSEAEDTIQRWTSNPVEQNVQIHRTTPLEQPIYRSVKAGPTSSALTSCPHCGQTLITGNVKEIDDQPSDAALLVKQDPNHLAGITPPPPAVPAPTNLQGSLSTVPDGGKNEDEC